MTAIYLKLEWLKRQVALDNARIMYDLARAAESMAMAIEEYDEILGPLAATAFINALTELPRNLREDIADAVSEEAARGMRADRLWWESREATP